MKPIPPGALAVLIATGFFAALFTLMFVDVAPSMKDPLMLMLGALMAAFAAVTGYYFGTTASSSRKDETIASLANPTSPAVGGETAAPAAKEQPQ